MLAGSLTRRAALAVVRHEPQQARAKPPSRQELTSSAVVDNIQTVGSAHPAQPRVAASVRVPTERLAAWRLGARQTTLSRPPPSRTADRRPNDLRPRAVTPNFFRLPRLHPIAA